MSNITRQNIVDAAMGYLYVKYAAGGMSVDPGLNCLGFIANVACDVGVITDEVFNSFEGKTNFTKDEPLIDLIAPFTDPLEDWRDAQPGDVLAIASEGDPHHCGILKYKEIRNGVATFYIVHASRNNGVEVRRFYGKLLKPIKAAYRVRGVVEDG